MSIPQKPKRVRLIGCGPTVDERTEDWLKATSEETGYSIGEIIDQLVEHIQGAGKAPKKKGSRNG